MLGMGTSQSIVDKLHRDLAQQNDDREPSVIGRRFANRTLAEAIRDAFNNQNRNVSAGLRVPVEGTYVIAITATTGHQSEEIVAYARLEEPGRNREGTVLIGVALPGDNADFNKHPAVKGLKYDAADHAWIGGEKQVLEALDKVIREWMTSRK